MPYIEPLSTSWTTKPSAAVSSYVALLSMNPCERLHHLVEFAWVTRHVIGDPRLKRDQLEPLAQEHGDDHDRPQRNESCQHGGQRT